MGFHPVLAAILCVFASISMLETVAMATRLHITHYTHEIRGGPDRTLLLSAGTNSENLTAGVGFGSFVVYDNVMREGPNNSSKVLGRAAGTAVGVIKPSPATGNATRVQMQMEHIYDEGSRYQGSTIAVAAIFYSINGPWEATVPGGTGHFRGYRGYGVSTLVSETPEPPPVYVVYRWDFYLSKEKY